MILGQQNVATLEYFYAVCITPLCHTILPHVSKKSKPAIVFHNVFKCCSQISVRFGVASAMNAKRRGLKLSVLSDVYAHDLVMLRDKIL